MRVVRTFVVSLGLAAAAAPARAQASGGTDVPDRFHLEGAYFRVGSEATLTLGGSGVGGADVDFSREFALPSTTNQGYLELYWRAGRRHLLQLGGSYSWDGVQALVSAAF